MDVLAVLALGGLQQARVAGLRRVGVVGGQVGEHAQSLGVVTQARLVAQAGDDRLVTRQDLRARKKGGWGDTLLAVRRGGSGPGAPSSLPR